MKILYHATFLQPPVPESVAELQEIEALCTQFGGNLIYLNPNKRSPIRLPRMVFGFQKLRQLRLRERAIDLHHVYNPDPYPFPVLKRLTRPIVYSISGGVGTERINARYFNSLSAVVVADDRSQVQLEAWGLENVAQVRAGIDVARFSCAPVPLHSTVKLMVGSAPWTRAQFQTKGVDALLAAAQQNRRIRLVFLWRGVLEDDIRRQIRQMNLQDQVTVHTNRVDVNEILASVHASITLAAARGIVKSYPHSLMESLAAGKPVLVSRPIPMADYIEQTGCGKVVDEVNPAGILAAIEALIDDYDSLQQTAEKVGQRDFSQQRMIESFATVYARALNRPD